MRLNRNKANFLARATHFCTTSAFSGESAHRQQPPGYYVARVSCWIEPKDTFYPSLYEGSCVGESGWIWRVNPGVAWQPWRSPICVLHFWRFARIFASVCELCIGRANLKIGSIMTSSLEIYVWRIYLGTWKQAVMRIKFRCQVANALVSFWIKFMTFS